MMAHTSRDADPSFLVLELILSLSDTTRGQFAIGEECGPQLRRYTQHSRSARMNSGFFLLYHVLTRNLIEGRDIAE